MISIFKFYPELKYFIPYEKDFKTQNFKKTFNYTRTLSFSDKNNKDDYKRFISLILKNIGVNYFPVLRISDGELLLLCGIQHESRRANFLKRLLENSKNIVRKLTKQNDYILYSHIFGSFDHTTGQSETYKFNKKKYASDKIENVKKKFIKEVKEISKAGILSIHLSYSSKYSLVEKFWLSFFKILNSNSISLNAQNCFPFYFVYMLLSDKKTFGNIIFNKKILCVSSASGSKQKNIIGSIANFKPKKIDWLAIPTSNTFFSEIETDKLPDDKYDIVLLAAGTGKTNIIMQLKKFNCPVIDCGFYFEVWNNNEFKYNRVGCVSDDEY